MSDFCWEEGEHLGCTYKVVPDDSPENPREAWDNVGTMYCRHRSYLLGDKDAKEPPRADDPDSIRAHIPDEVWNGWLTHTNQFDLEDMSPENLRRRAGKWIRENILQLPLYLYDHSGLTMRTTGFSCPWDSGQVGVIWCTMETARKEWFSEGCTDAEVRKKALKYLKGEVETYDAYLTNRVAGAIAEDWDGNEIDSCWGIYPDEDGHGYEYAVNMAKEWIDSHIDGGHVPPDGDWATPTTAAPSPDG